MLEHPADLLYSHRHMWVKIDEDQQEAVVGVTEDYIEEVPEIISIDMPMVGDELEMDADCLHLHVRAPDLTILHAPLSGRVTEINRDVLDTPELLHAAPYKRWLFKMEYDEVEELEMLMIAKRYEYFLDHVDTET